MPKKPSARTPRPKPRYPIAVDVTIQVTISRDQAQRLLPFAWGLMGGRTQKPADIIDAARLAILHGGASQAMSSYVTTIKTEAIEIHTEKELAELRRSDGEKKQRFGV